MMEDYCGSAQKHKAVPKDEVSKVITTFPSLIQCSQLKVVLQTVIQKPHNRISQISRAETEILTGVKGHSTECANKVGEKYQETVMTGNEYVCQDDTEHSGIVNTNCDVGYNFRSVRQIFKKKKRTKSSADGNHSLGTVAPSYHTVNTNRIVLDGLVVKSSPYSVSFSKTMATKPPEWNSNTPKSLSSPDLSHFCGRNLSYAPFEVNRRSSCTKDSFKISPKLSSLNQKPSCFIPERSVSFNSAIAKFSNPPPCSVSACAKSSISSFERDQATKPSQYWESVGPDSRPERNIQIKPSITAISSLASQSDMFDSWLQSVISSHDPSILPDHSQNLTHCSSGKGKDVGQCYIAGHRPDDIISKTASVFDRQTEVRMDIDAGDSQSKNICERNKTSCSELSSVCDIRQDVGVSDHCNARRVKKHTVNLGSDLVSKGRKLHSNSIRSTSSSTACSDHSNPSSEQYSSLGTKLIPTQTFESKGLPQKSHVLINDVQCEPPVKICVTEDPDVVEAQPDTDEDTDLRIPHQLLSPRSSFGSVYSCKSSNADSAVDLGNPDEDAYLETCIESQVSVGDGSKLFHSLGSPPDALSSWHLPRLLVSDHSCEQSQMPEHVHVQESKNDTGNKEWIPRPWSPEDSAYSGNSDFDPDATDEEEPPPPPQPRRKQSSWKLIRGIIKWSPFVQVFKKNKYPWIQLAGHQGNFQAGESGAVLKKLDARERQCYLRLMTDCLKPFVPEYRGDTEKSGESYIQLQDLLCEFNTPCVMDIKMGCRTYLEEELEKARSKPTLRKDMYKKMIEVDPNAPTQVEREAEGVTKARYLQWRDGISSSTDLGFRIEGIKKSDGNSSKDFKKTKTNEHVHEVLQSFIGNNTHAVEQYIMRLKAIREAQEKSPFFERHEVISSSLLFVHDSEKANIWMIDFGKTEPLPQSVKTDHRSQWEEGNHEDGYFAGLDRLISILTDLVSKT